MKNHEQVLRITVYGTENQRKEELHGHVAALADVQEFIDKCTIQSEV